MQKYAESKAQRFELKTETRPQNLEKLKDEVPIFVFPEKLTPFHRPGREEGEREAQLQPEVLQAGAGLRGEAGGGAAERGARDP